MAESPATKFPNDPQRRGHGGYRAASRAFARHSIPMTNGARGRPLDMDRRYSANPTGQPLEGFEPPTC